MVQQNDFIEHRIAARWQLDLQAKMRLEGAQVSSQCTVKDISFKGMQVSLGFRLLKDTFLKLSVALSDVVVLDVEAWVVWQKTIDGFNLYGLYFSKIKDADKEKIYQFVRQNFPKEMSKLWWKGFTPEKRGEKMEDVRIFARIAAQLPVRFIDLRKNKEAEGQTQDIGAKGVGLLTKERLQPNTPLEIWLKIPDRGEPLYTRGEVVWSKELKPNRCISGVSLEKADLMGLARVLRVA